MNRKDWEAQVFASNMNTTARVIALVVGTFGNWTTDKTVEPGTTKIAAMAGVTRDTVDTYLEAMVEQGWLNPIGTGKYNTTIYELCPVVADTTGILARKKRAMNPKSLAKMNNLVAGTTDNLDEVDEILVADTSGVSCRKQDSKLPKAEALVADSTGSNLKNLEYNLEEPTPAAPVENKIVEIRSTDSPSPLTTESTDMAHTDLTDRTLSPRILTPGEKQVLVTQARIYKLDREATVLLTKAVEQTSPRMDIYDATRQALAGMGIEMEEDDW